METHLLDFCEDIYGEEIEIFFHMHKRDEIKFDTLEELVKQINSDIKDRYAYEH